ncbi:MAG: FGGY-family carbohydrate kinase [Actinomycetota bacterium]
MGNLSRYLAIDAGTSGIKAGIVDENNKIIGQNSLSYSYSIPCKNNVEADFNLLYSRMLKVLQPLRAGFKDLEGIGFSVLCPGLIPMDREGEALSDAIIHLDRRSIREAKWALSTIGEKQFLQKTGNLPFPGGISLTSLLWIKNNSPGIYKEAYKFGHTNTFLAKRITGNFGIDPTNASFTGLYNTVDYSQWNAGIISSLGLDEDKLPPVISSKDIVGKVSRNFSGLTGIREGTPVIMGAADTACAALGAGVVDAGDILNSTGTVEAIVMCMDKPFCDKKLLLRTHPLENRWLSMYIIGAGGLSIEWFRKQFCGDMDYSFFYNKYLPSTIRRMDKSDVSFKPYLAGDRLSFSQKKGSFSSLTLNTTREDMLLALLKGIIKPMHDGIKKFKTLCNTSKPIHYTGKGSDILYEVKKKHFQPYQLKLSIPNVTLLGAAKLIKEGLR